MQNRGDGQRGRTNVGELGLASVIHKTSGGGQSTKVYKDL